MKDLPTALTHATYYRQRPHTQPNGHVLQTEQEWIELILEGRGWVPAQGEWIEVTPGSINWMQPGDSTVGRSDEANPYACLALHFNMPKRPRAIPQFTRWEDLEEARRFAKEILRLYYEEQFDNRDLLPYTYGQLLLRARRWQQSSERTALPTPIREGVRILEQRYPESLTIEQVAAEVGWSAPHFHATFRKHFELSPHQYLMRRRLQAARERLANSEAPIKEIAIDCGFHSAAAFCATFRSRTGTTPAAFRKAHRWS